MQTGKSLHLKNTDVHPKIKDVLEKEGISEFYPPQKKALPYIINGENVILSFPTASGKTLMAEIAVLQNHLEKVEGQDGKNAEVEEKKNNSPHPPQSENIGKALYLCPLRALANEKYHEFKDKWSALGIDIGLAMGDLDRREFYVFRNDLIILTNEKADSLFRMRPEYLYNIDVVIVDEMHLINDKDRGVTLEFLLTRILTLNKDIQIVGLSATIKNSKELAKWIGGKLVKSEWRPVDLRQGFFLQDSIHFQDGSHRTINMIPGHGTMFSLTLDMIKEGGQVLIFTNSRRSTMSLATKLAPKLRLSSSQEEKDDLDGLTNEFKAFYWDDLDSTKDLLKSLRGGIAFHHAGLKSDKLNFIVEKFNQGIIKVIVCTPTLAAGVNTPARRVIIKSLYRYESGKGMVTIPIIEYKQMAGRAGRPHFDPYGEVVIYNKKQDKVYDLAKQYIEGEPEEIISKIGKQNSLESHVLSLIVSKIARTKDEILKFLENSFYFYQLSNRPESEHSKICSFSEGFSEQVKGSKSKSVRNKKKTPKKPEINMGKGKDPLKLNAASDMFFQNAADLLKNKKKEEKMHKKRDMGHFMAREKIYHILESQLKEILTNFVLDGFLTVNATVSDIQKYQNTELGRITTQMYLPPSDALILYSGLEKALKIMEISSNPNKYQSRALAGKTIKTVTWLNLITQLSSFWKFYLKQHEFSVSQMFLDDNSEFLLVDEIPQPKQSNYRSFLEEIKLTMILNTWISEMDESEIIEKFGIGAGDLFRTVSTAKWLFRALLKLSKLQEFGDLHGKIEPLYLRIQHGVRPNLLELVRLKGIGRKRARMLYRGGLKTLNDIDNASIEKISNIPNFGMELAKSIKKQISQNHVGKTPLEENGQSNEETAHHKKEMHKKKGKGSDLTSINSIKKKAVSRDPSDGPKLLKNSSSLDSSKKDKVKGENSKDKPSRPKKTLDFFM